MVTGASSGIGRATAERLARAGHTVMMGARRIDECEELADRLNADGARVLAAPLDVTDAGSVERFVERTRSELDRVDALISNAGQSRPMPAVEYDHTVVANIVAVNLLGAQALTAAFAPAMIDRGEGDLIFISSEVVNGPPRPLMSAYSASKHALEAWISVLHCELEATGVRASVVRPGHTVTGYASDWTEGQITPMVSAWNRFGVLRHLEMLQADEVAHVLQTVLEYPPHVHLRLVEVQPSIPRGAGVEA